MADDKKFLELLGENQENTVSNSTLQSNAQLSAAEKSGVPDTYSNTYGGKIDSAINSWLANRGFSYNTADDKDYQRYTEQYRQNADTGREISRQTANTLANGYRPSYADVVSDEVFNRRMENVSDAVPSYKEMAQLDYNAEQSRLANAASIYSQLDSANYSRSRDNAQDYKNMLNTLYSRYVADRQADAELDSYNNSIYGTRLSAEESNLQDSRSSELARYLYNTQSADSAARIAQDEAENERKIQYSKAEDAYKAYIKEASKTSVEKGKTRNAEAVFAAMGVTKNDFKEDGSKYDEKGIENYVTYSKAYIDGAYEAGRINGDEREYLYDKIGVTSDDESYNNSIAESFINAYLRKKVPKVTADGEEIGFEDIGNYKNGEVVSTGYEYVYANDAFTKKQLEIGFDKGYISADDVAYIAAKLGVKI